MYVMRIVGRALGIREELNMCTGNLAEVREVAREILVTAIQVSVTRYSLSVQFNSTAGVPGGQCVQREQGA